ncbi:MAG: tRNA (adenosine(37)-N6)-dimethylallyltransferase, partial [Pseudobdellovibrionaceae bacterium]
EKVRANTVYVVGGTGFYFQAIEKGLYSVSQTPPELKEEIENWLSTPEGLEAGYRELKGLDPEATAKISEQDAYRIGRALELIRCEKKTLTQIQKEFAEQAKPFPYPLKKIGIHLTREQLEPRIQARTKKMLEHGLIEEVEALMKKGLETWAPLRSVGYKETVQFLKENKSRQWLYDEICLRTLQLAKKQKTWFKRDPQIEWLTP